MPIVVVAHDPRWADQYREVRQQLLAALAGVAVHSIEHVGSTSVPGLAAKPRLDIDVVVAAEQVPAARAALESAGYEWRGDLGIPYRYALRAPDQSPPRNVYIVIDGCLALRNHLAVRDLLRRDARMRDQYAQFKLDLAERDYVDADLYARDKSPILQRILAAAGMDRDELAAIDAVNRLDR